MTSPTPAFALLASLTLASTTLAQTVPADRMVLNGYWGTWKSFLAGAAGGHKPMLAGSKDLEVAATHLQPWARARYDAAMARDKAGKFVANNTNKCYPADIAGVPLVDAYSIEILVEPHVVAFLAEGGRTIRLIRIGGHHPEGLSPSWMGDSVGHWDGDTLVVDTIGFNDKAELPHSLPMTSKMHIVERLHVTNGVLEDHATYDDPGAFTAPFTVDMKFDRSEAFQEYICAENNREGGVPTSTGKPTVAVVSGLDQH